MLFLSSKALILYLQIDKAALNLSIATFTICYIKVLVTGRYIYHGYKHSSFQQIHYTVAKTTEKEPEVRRVPVDMSPVQRFEVKHITLLSSM